MALITLEAQLVGLWVYGRRGGEGDFCIIPNPSEKSDGGLVFVDLEHSQAGVLVGPTDPRWIQPPQGFPALLCARLSPQGCGIVWLRLNRPRELMVVWKAEAKADARWRRNPAFRMPGAPGTVTTFSYLAVHALHSIADGASYEAIVGDLLTLYHSLRPEGVVGGHGADLPPAANGLLVLQKRLQACLSAADPIAVPQITSLRGSLWKYRGKGYNHSIQLRSGAIAAIKQMSAIFSTPPDALLLSLVAASIARASDLNVVPLSLYVPNRDGPGEANLVGLFSDWRDIEVRTDLETATILGVILEVADLLRSRRWAVFNALAKPEVTMVNFQPYDAAPPGSRAGFVQLAEEQWRNGDRLQRTGRRGDELGAVQQPLSVTIEQQDLTCSWIHFTMDYEAHPPTWTRRFVRAFTDAFQAALAQPVQRVHRDFPVDFY